MNLDKNRKKGKKLEELALSEMEDQSSSLKNEVEILW